MEAVLAKVDRVIIVPTTDDFLLVEFALITGEFDPTIAKDSGDFS
jgi:hypothetical protein